MYAFSNAACTVAGGCDVVSAGFGASCGLGASAGLSNPFGSVPWGFVVAAGLSAGFVSAGFGAGFVSAGFGAGFASSCFSLCCHSLKLRRHCLFTF